MSIETIMEEFDETKFAKGGGSCFECCDFEGMYVDLQDFIRDALTKQREEFVEMLRGMDVEMPIRDPLWIGLVNGVYDGKEVMQDQWRKQRDDLIKKLNK